MTGFIIFLIIIAVIFLLLIIPVNLYVEYDGENTSLKVRYAFIKIKILPQSEKKKKSPKKSSDKKKKSKPDGKQTDSNITPPKWKADSSSSTPSRYLRAPAL